MKLQVSKIMGKLFSQEIPYSTKEIRIGTWINGKPIYRKTIEINAIEAGGTGYRNISSLNIDTFFINFNKSYLKTNNIWLPLIRTHTSAINSQIEPRFNFTSGQIEIRCGSGINIQSGIITIEYTKTTD